MTNFTNIKYMVTVDYDSFYFGLVDNKEKDSYDLHVGLYSGDEKDSISNVVVVESSNKSKYKHLHDNEKSVKKINKLIINNIISQYLQNVKYQR